MYTTEVPAVFLFVFLLFICNVLLSIAFCAFGRTLSLVTKQYQKLTGARHPPVSKVVWLVFVGSFLSRTVFPASMTYVRADIFVGTKTKKLSGLFFLLYGGGEGGGRGRYSYNTS